MISQLAGQLGIQGIWIDQVTTLDPHPEQGLNNDPDVNLFANIVFADNYWRQDGTLGEVADVDGQPVAGAFDFELNESVLGGNPDLGNSLEHSDAHLFYYGSMNLSPSATSEGVLVPASWYPDHGVSRDAIGYHYSRIGAGNRFTGPAIAGLHPLFGVQNARVPLDLSAATWPSLIALGLNGGDLTYVAGDLIHPVPFYADVDSGGLITYFLDKDTNPYNTDEVVLGQHVYSSTGTGVVFDDQRAFSTAGAAPGTYQVYAQITDANGWTRFLYAGNSVEIIAPPPAGAIAPLVTLSANDKSASETGGGTSAGRGTVTLSRSGPTTQPLTVNYSFAGTAANDGSDYALLTGSVVIPIGATKATIAVDPVDDAIGEVAETVVVTLTESSSYRLGSASQRIQTVTIADNESVVSISAADNSAAEATPANATGKVRITRTGGSTVNPLTVFYSVGGTATSGDDYAALTGTAVIPAGMAFVDVIITPVDDGHRESAETVIVSLTSDVTYNIQSTKSVATVTIADNEPVLKIKATDSSATEKGAGALAARALFTITRSGGSTALPLVVNYSTGGTATAGDDYGTLAGTATIPAGATSVTIELNPIDDIITEQVETIILTLVDSDRYRLGRTTEQTATAKITDYELAPDSLSGRALSATISAGSDPFAPKGTYQLIASDSNNRYLLVGGTGVDSSLGEFLYEKLTSTTGLLTFEDSILGHGEGTLTFTSTTRATFSFTGDLGGFQTGSMTLLPTAAQIAAASVSNRVGKATISSGTSPLASKGTFQMSLAANGSYNLIGGTGVQSSSGTYTYERFNANVGMMTFDDVLAGPGWGVFTFTTLSKASYVLVDEATLAVQRGSMTFV